MLQHKVSWGNGRRRCVRCALPESDAGTFLGLSGVSLCLEKVGGRASLENFFGDPAPQGPREGREELREIVRALSRLEVSRSEAVVPHDNVERACVVANDLGRELLRFLAMDAVNHNLPIDNRTPEDAVLGIRPVDREAAPDEAAPHPAVFNIARPQVRETIELVDFRNLVDLVASEAKVRRPLECSLFDLQRCAIGMATSSMKFIAALSIFAFQFT